MADSEMAQDAAAWPDGTGPMVRLSIPGNECSHCGTVMTAALRCGGCGWVDPLTKSTARSAVVRPTRDAAIQAVRARMPFILGLDYDDRAELAEAAADAVLALFGVAVSDSQETPQEGREE